MSPLERVLRARLASAYRRRARDPEQIERLRRDLAAEQVACHVRRILGSAPPLTTAQRQGLAALVLEGGDADALA